MTQNRCFIARHVLVYCTAADSAEFGHAHGDTPQVQTPLACGPGCDGQLAWCHHLPRQALEAGESHPAEHVHLLHFVDCFWLMIAMPVNLTAMLNVAQRQGLPVHQTTSVRAMLCLLIGRRHLMSIGHKQHAIVRLPCKVSLHLTMLMQCTVLNHVATLKLV